MSDDLADLKRKHGAWRYWYWVGILRGLWLWARVRYWGWRGVPHTIRLGPGLHVWPGAWRKSRYTNLRFDGGGEGREP